MPKQFSIMRLNLCQTLRVHRDIQIIMKLSQKIYRIKIYVSWTDQIRNKLRKNFLHFLHHTQVPTDKMTYSKIFFHRNHT